MSLVYAGACSHAPGITGRAERADPELRESFYKNFRRLGQEIHDAKPDALVIIGAEHFANFFMDNMPAICVGMADHYESPIEDEQWLGIQRTRVPGNAELSRRLIERILQSSDVAYAEEWKFDHGVAVPLNFLTPDYDIPIIPVNINCQGPPLIPLHRAYAFGQALRTAIDGIPERIAVVCTGGISHWPATPDSGKINEAWDREFLDRFINNRRDEILSYTDEETYRDAGQGGFEIRTFIALAGLCGGATGELYFYAPIPIFAVGCTVARMNLS
ncbi:MAG: extradiol ring-cleavage dioxygenase [Gammaproteobacteria bacterium]|nr:extradiol ring-cleavage dioxygenase [Gammaproteobacteria bacterium]